MDEMQSKARMLIRKNWASMNKEQQAVLTLICEATLKGEKIQQHEIARSEKYLGCHPVHEVHRARKFESTLRKIRQIVKDIRTEYRIPIISDRGGYWIVEDKAQAIEFLTSMEKKIKAWTRTSFETYAVMKDSLSINMDFFEQNKHLLGDDDE